MKYRSCDHSALKAYFHFSPRSLWKEFQHFALISSLTYPTIAFAVDLFVMNPIHGPLMIGSMDRIGGPPLASIPQLVPNEDTILPHSFSLCKNNATKIKCVCIIRGLGPKPIRVRVPSSWKTWSPEQISNLVPSRIFQTNPIVLHKHFCNICVTCLNVKQYRIKH